MNDALTKAVSIPYYKIENGENKVRSSQDLIHHPPQHTYHTHHIILHTISTSGSSVYMSPSIIFLRIVEVTEAPKSMAPRNSHTPAMRTACFNVMDLAETDVANALATGIKT